MKFGVAIPSSHQGVYAPPRFAGPGEITRIVELAERLGFHSAWGLDFMATRERNANYDNAALEWHEILVTLSFLAARTSRIRLGTASLQLPLRDPFLLARQAATLDVFSGGRFMLGLGLGTDRTEFVKMKPRDRDMRRGDLFLESLAALEQFFSANNVTLNGQCYQCEDLSLFPKPVQKPFPLYISGTTDDTPRRIARWGSGWLLSRAQVRMIDDRLDALETELHRVGRKREDIDLVVTKGLSLGKTREEALKKFYDSILPRKMDSIATVLGVGGKPSEDLNLVFEQNFIGTPADVAEQVAEIRGKRIDHTVLYYFPAPTAQEMMDQLQWFAEEVVPIAG